MSEARTTSDGIFPLRRIIWRAALPVLAEPDSRICAAGTMYWSPECRMLCSTSMVSTSLNAVSAGAGCQNQRTPGTSPYGVGRKRSGSARKSAGCCAADFKGGRTAFGQGDDGFGVNRARHADRTAGNRQVGADRFDISTYPANVLLSESRFFRSRADNRHLAICLNGYADGGFGGTHHRIGTVQYRVCHIADFGAGRHGVGNHRFHHLRRRNAEAAQTAGAADHPFCATAAVRLRPLLPRREPPPSLMRMISSKFSIALRSIWNQTGRTAKGFFISSTLRRYANLRRISQLMAR